MTYCFFQKLQPPWRSGEYRQLISKPSDLNWKFVRYNNPTEKLLLSDLDRLERTQSLHTVTGTAL